MPTLQERIEESKERFKKFCKERNWHPVSMGVEIDHYQAFLEQELISLSDAVRKEDGEWKNAHAQFVADVLDGVKPEEAYETLNSRLSSPSENQS